MAIKTSQQGSAHVIIIVVLVLGLLGALGYIFWQNFINSSDSKKQTDTTSLKSTIKEAAKPKLKQASIDPTFGTSLSFEYPETWTMSRSTNGPFPPNPEVEPTSESFIVTSPNNEIEVRYYINANAGFGYVCEDETSPIVTKLKFESIPGYAGASAVEYISKDKNLYTLNTYIQNTAGLADVKAGDSTCKLAGGLIMQLNETNRVYLMGSGISIKKFVDENNVAKQLSTVEEIEAELKSDAYTQAKAIVLSTKVGS